MAELKASQVKASTLLEVIVAMVIILIVFTLAIGIYTNVLRTTSSVRQEQARAMTDSKIEQSILEENWSDEDSIEDGVALQKKVLPYETYSDLVVITVTAFEQEKQIGQARRIVTKIRR